MEIPYKEFSLNSIARHNNTVLLFYLKKLSTVLFSYFLCGAKETPTFLY